MPEARLSRVIAALRQFDVAVEKPAGGGSHWKCKKAGYRTYPLVGHNGTKSKQTD